MLFLTARDATEDKVSGLTIGGDDYVTKPFSLEEVIARVRAVLRRRAAISGATFARGSLWLLLPALLALWLSLPSAR